MRLIKAYQSKVITNYHRFSRWQQAEPHYVNRHQDIVQHCHNCGTQFADNFCPRCGQRAEVGRVGWNSIKDNIAPPALRLWLVGYVVAIGSHLTISSHDDGCRGSDYFDFL